MLHSFSMGFPPRVVHDLWPFDVTDRRLWLIVSQYICRVYQEVTVWIGDCLQTGKSSWYITSKVNSAFCPSFDISLSLLECRSWVQLWRREVIICCLNLQTLLSVLSDIAPWPRSFWPLLVICGLSAYPLMYTWTLLRVLRRSKTTVERTASVTSLSRRTRKAQCLK